MREPIRETLALLASTGPSSARAGLSPDDGKRAKNPTSIVSYRFDVAPAEKKRAHSKKHTTSLKHFAGEKKTPDGTSQGTDCVEAHST